MPFEVIEFKNFNSKEIVIIGNALAKIFTRRLILKETHLLFPEFENLHIRIQDGIPENFSIPESAFLKVGWIPDAKFKIHTNSDADKRKFFYNVSKIVWLEVSIDADIAKSKKDIMSFVSQKPENIVLICFFNEDKKGSKLILRFYLIQGKNGWKKIKEYYYTSFRNVRSNEENEENKNSKIIEFKDLSPREKGEIGEAIANILTNRILLEGKSLFFPEKDIIRIEDQVSAYLDNPSQTIFSYQTNNMNIFGSWEPDGIFQVLTSSDPFDSISKVNQKKIVYLEVKTGKNARFERTQLSDMENISKIQNFIVLFCQVFPETKYSILIFNFFIVKSDSDWKLIKQYYYSDFSLYKYVRENSNKVSKE